MKIQLLLFFVFVFSSYSIENYQINPQIPIQFKQTIQSNRKSVCGKKPKTTGSCGKTCTFHYYHLERKLVVEGEEMEKYLSRNDVPWNVQMKNIQTIETINLKTIEENAFNGAISLETVILNEGLETIGNSAFSNCNKLKSITIPSTVQTIENAVFDGCNQLKLSLNEKNKYFILDEFGVLYD